MNENKKIDAQNRYLICLTIAPAFFTGSIYLCLARLIPIYDPGNTLSRFAPKTYTYLFISADFFSLALQAIGGGISATAATVDATWAGIHVMIAGLAFQVFSLVIFSALCVELAMRVRRMQPSRSPNHTRRDGKRTLGLDLGSLHAFELALVAATVLIIVRSIYRCAELAGGFRGDLANEEVPFMILEGAMIVLACVCLTVWHPGWVLKGEWMNVAERAKGVHGSELLGMAGKIDGAAGSGSYVNIDR